MNGSRALPGIRTGGPAGREPAQEAERSFSCPGTAPGGVPGVAQLLYLCGVEGDTRGKTPCVSGGMGAAPQRLVHFHPARLFFMPKNCRPLMR